MLAAATFVILAYAAGSLWLGRGIPTGWKVAGSLLLLLASCKYYIYEWFGGSFFAPRLPRYFQLAMEALYASLVLLFALLLARDLLRLLLWLMHRRGVCLGISLSAGWLWPVLAACALGLGIWGTWQSVRLPRVAERVVRLPGLPSGLNGFRLVQLSDLHIGPLLDRPWLAGVVDRVNSLRPDLVALTGDYVDGTVGELGEELAPLAGLRARYGVFAVTGNHEYYWDAAAWRLALERLGLTFLENSHVVLPVDGGSLVLAGLPDLVAGRFGHDTPDLDRALAGAPQGQRAPRVLLAHQPRHAGEYAGRVDLHLAGHTHGGQLFFLRPLIAWFNGGFVGGAYDLGGALLLVSPGTGLWGGFSCRLGVPAEISLIILEGKDS